MRAPSIRSVTDFGIAKRLDPLEGADAGATLASARPRTPDDASPEPVRDQPVGTATHSCRMGVLLSLMCAGPAQAQAARLSGVAG